MTKKTKDKKKEKELNFYDVFRIGLEIEGEFILRQSKIADIFANNNNHDIEIDEDGSLRSNGNGDILELKSPIIENTADEKTFVEALRSIEKPAELRQTAFAYQNKSAGTHIHFSFNPDFRDVPNVKIDGGRDNLLRVFDSVEFEKYFFKKYFGSFKLEKFYSRMHNDYCQPAIPASYNSNTGRIETQEYRLDNVEDMKASKDKYKWLNPAQIMDGRGMELRIFPYLTTADGVQDVINFSKQILLAYFNRKGTQDKVEDVAKFYQISENYRLDQEKLNMYDQILMKHLHYNRNQNHFSFDLMAFITYLFSKKPTAFLKLEN